MSYRQNDVLVPESGRIFHNDVQLSKYYFNDVLVWNKVNQLWPGNSEWNLLVNQNDGGAGWGANSYIDGNFLVITAGYNGSSGRINKWFDATGWNRARIVLSWTTLSYFQLRWGIWSSSWTNIYGDNEVRVTKKDGASGNHTGAYDINISDLSGGYYIGVYLYAGSTVSACQVGIGNITLYK